MIQFYCFYPTFSLSGPEMEERTVLVAGWSFVPATLSPAPSRRRTSGRNSVLLLTAGTLTSTVYLQMFAGCPSTAEVRIVFFTSQWHLNTYFMNNSHNVSFAFIWVTVKQLSVFYLLCQFWWRTDVSCSAGLQAAQPTISSGTGSLTARRVDPIPTTSVSRACAEWVF